MKTITHTITEDQLIAQFGEDALVNLSNDNGYFETVNNPDYVPAQGSETINDPDHVPPEGYDEMEYEWPQVANPDYVPAVGEQTIPNPVSRLQFIAESIRDKGLDGTAERTRQRMLRDAMKATEDAFMADWNTRIQAIKDGMTQEVTE